MKLYAHPFSSYCQKALTALYETETAFEYRHLEEPGVMAELTALWPMKRFPILTDGETVVLEATGIVEYVDARHGQSRLIPKDPLAAVEVRMMDRVFDNYINTPQQRFVFDILRPEADRDPYGVEEARRMLDTAYAWLDQRLAGKEWATEHGFTLADCAAAPALFYADWTHAIPERFEALHAYRARLLARPSFARCVEDARRYRHYFPLGAPDRD
ncbi:glutathione S-transferase family protein [Brevundimonas sp.]|jgi:glutathione S-transferase|uniref:glutathione S-transferase family protein n=1 Tax=Brevundimonas sp. TaxID=1871086 RepID=UPI0037BEBCB9